MKLTNEQIDLIERYLEQQNLKFIDLKVEVIDHISCEIESEMSSKNQSFEKSCALVFQRWKPELQISKSWLLGLENSFPKIVVRSIFKKVLFHYGFVVLSVIFICLSFVLNNEIKMNANVIIIFKNALVIFGVIYFLMRRKINRTKIITTYSFQFSCFYFPLLLVFIYLFVLKGSIIHFFLMMFFVVNLPFAFYFYYKHFQTVNKLF